MEEHFGKEVQIRNRNELAFAYTILQLPIFILSKLHTNRSKLNKSRITIKFKIYLQPGIGSPTALCREFARRFPKRVQLSSKWSLFALWLLVRSVLKSFRDEGRNNSWRENQYENRIECARTVPTWLCCIWSLYEWNITNKQGERSREYVLY